MKRGLDMKLLKNIFLFLNGPRLCLKCPVSPLIVVEFRTISGDFKLQQKSASAKIFTINLSDKFFSFGCHKVVEVVKKS